jgi:hypothetical protein
MSHSQVVPAGLPPISELDGATSRFLPLSLALYQPIESRTVGAMTRLESRAMHEVPRRCMPQPSVESWKEVSHI